MQRIPSHASDAIARIASEYVGKTKMEAMTGLIGDRTQVTEDALWAFSTDLTLDGATGAQLDVLGAMVGESRASKDDDAYRIFIRARVLVNKSSGTGDEILDIFVMLLSDLGAYTVELLELQPATILVQVHGSFDEVDAQSLSVILRSARAAGIGSWMVWSPAADASTFSLSTVQVDDNGLISNSQGLGGPAANSDGSDQHGSSTFTSDAAFDMVALGYTAPGSAIITDCLTGAFETFAYTGVSTHALTGLTPSVPAGWTSDLYAAPVTGGHFAGAKEA